MTTWCGGRPQHGPLPKHPIDAVLLGPGAISHSWTKTIEKLNKLAIPTYLESYSFSGYQSGARNRVGVVGTLASTAGLNRRFLLHRHILCLGASFRDTIIPVFRDAPEGLELTVVDYNASEVSSDIEHLVFQFHSIDSFDLDGVELTEVGWEEIDAVRSRSVQSVPSWSGQIESTRDVLLAISECLGNGETLIWDSGTIDVLAPRSLFWTGPTFVARPYSQGAMGFALGGIVGALAIRPNADVIALVGDGSLSMNSQELQTVAGVPGTVHLVCIENGMYQIIRERQAALFRGRTIGTGSENGVPQFSPGKLSSLLGWKVHQVTTFADIQSGFFSNRQNGLKNLYVVTIESDVPTELGERS